MCTILNFVMHINRKIVGLEKKGMWHFRESKRNSSHYNHVSSLTNKNREDMEKHRFRLTTFLSVKL